MNTEEKRIVDLVTTAIKNTNYANKAGPKMFTPRELLDVVAYCFMQSKDGRVNHLELMAKAMNMLKPMRKK